MKITISQSEDQYEGILGQELKFDGSVIHSVWNLYDCPEDASINRDLTSAHDALSLIQYGYDLAKKGEEIDFSDVEILTNEED